MSVFDVRGEQVSEVQEIVFSDETVDDTTVAYCIKPYKNYKGEIVIADSDYDGASQGYVVIVSKEDGENLIKGLHKAIELGWLK